MPGVWNNKNLSYLKERNAAIKAREEVLAGIRKDNSMAKAADAEYKKGVNYTSLLNTASNNSTDLVKQGLANTGAASVQSLTNAGQIDKETLSNSGKLAEQGLRNTGALQVQNVQDSSAMDRLKVTGDQATQGRNQGAALQLVSTGQATPEQADLIAGGSRGVNGMDTAFRLGGPIKPPVDTTPNFATMDTYSEDPVTKLQYKSGTTLYNTSTGKPYEPSSVGDFYETPQQVPQQGPLEQQSSVGPRRAQMGPTQLLPQPELPRIVDQLKPRKRTQGLV